MTSPVSGMIQTIIQLRELNDRESMQRLQEKELGLRVENTQEEALGNLQRVLSATPNPKAFLQYAPMFAKSLGKDESFVRDLISNTSPNPEAIKGSMVAQGASSVDPKDVASRFLAGALQGEVAQDSFQKRIIGMASDAITNLSPEKLGEFRTDLMNRMALGESPEVAAQTEMWRRLPKEKQDYYYGIAKGAFPSADAVVQGRMAAARFMMDQMTAQDAHAETMFHIQLAMDEAKAKLAKDRQTQVLDELKAMDGLVRSIKPGDKGTTREGYIKLQMNQHTQILRTIAPELFDKNGSLPIQDIPMDKPWISGLFDFGKAVARQIPLVGGLIPPSGNP